MREVEIREHLINDIIPFWKSLKDHEYGGYYGKMDYDLKLYKNADKGCVLNSRILWFFSNAYLTIKDEECLEYARHAFKFLKNVFLDKEYGGLYWLVTYDGMIKDDTKYTYNQAFGIYALSSYYDASKDEEALRLAYELLDLVESSCRDEIGYLEAFNRMFKPLDYKKLLDHGVRASRTMNTLLHLFEAYTELYRVDKNKKIADCMTYILDIFADKVYNPKLKRLETFFDHDMNTLIDLHSYGHDIEASWLIDRGLEILNDPKYIKKISPITKELTTSIHSLALDNDDSLFNECQEKRVDSKKVWWVQAEAVLGFLNGYKKDPSKKDYLNRAAKIWDYIKSNMIDSRKGSEWFNELNRDGNPIKDKDIVGPWKCPYHNGRMCLEVIKWNISF